MNRLITISKMVTSKGISYAVAVAGRGHVGTVYRNEESGAKDWLGVTPDSPKPVAHGFTRKACIERLVGHEAPEDMQTRRAFDNVQAGVMRQVHSRTIQNNADTKARIRGLKMELSAGFRAIETRHRRPSIKIELIANCSKAIAALDRAAKAFNNMGVSLKDMGVHQ